MGPPKSIRWAAILSPDYPELTAFVKKLEESSWGAGTAQTLNYIITDKLANVDLQTTEIIITNPSMSDNDITSIIHVGALPVSIMCYNNTVTPLKGTTIVPSDYNGMRWIFNAKHI